MSLGKVKFGVRENTNGLISASGAEKCVFLTVTFRRGTSVDEAFERFKRFRYVLEKEFEGAVRIAEFTKKGTIHFHLIAALREDCDVQFGFNWRAYKQSRKDGKTRRLTNSETLKRLWSDSVQWRKRYRLGRTEIVPLASSLGAAHYISKYVSKSLGGSREGRIEWSQKQQISDSRKRLRSVGYICSKRFRKVRSKFSWSEGKGRSWRMWVALVAQRLKAKDLSSMRRKCGEKWAYKLTKLLELYESKMEDIKGTSKELKMLCMRWQIAGVFAYALGRGEIGRFAGEAEAFDFIFA